MLNASPRFYWSIILFTIFLQNTTKCDSYFIITKYGKVWLLFYYKVRQNATIILLQNVTVLQQNATVSTKCDDFISKCDSYCKMLPFLQNASAHMIYLSSKPTSTQTNFQLSRSRYQHLCEFLTHMSVYTLSASYTFGYIWMLDAP